MSAEGTAMATTDTQEVRELAPSREIDRVTFAQIRRRGVGGSDVAGILGLDRWKTPHDVWAQKLGIAPYEESEAARWGKLLEPLVLAEYALREKVALAAPAPAEGAPYVITNPKSPRFLQHRELGWVRATVDAFVAGQRVGVDAKITNPQWARDWGEPGTDAIPRTVLCQAVWYMGVTGFERWDIPVFFANRMEIYRVRRDDDLFGLLVERCGEFWERYVLRKVPPPLDASESSKRLVARAFPRDLVPLRPATEREAALAAGYMAAEAGIEGWERVLAQARNLLCASIGEAAGIEGPWGKITWKAPKPKQIVAWKAVAEV